MPEIATTIEELDANRPIDGAVLSEEDDQLRLVKIVEKLTFLGITGDGFSKNITANENELNFLSGVTSSIIDQINVLKNGQVPVGGIIAFTGILTAIPARFFVCNGLNGTPDLVDRFVRGTSNEGAMYIPGGSADAVNVTHNHNVDHTHTGSMSLDGAHQHDMPPVNPSNTNVANPFGEPKGDNATPPPNVPLTKPAGAHNHTISIASEAKITSTIGNPAAGFNMPAYYKLFFIMRVS